MTGILDILKNMFSSFVLMSVWDIIDILCVAFLLYKLFTLLRNTNTMQVVKGLVLFLIILALSEILNLHVMSFILSNAMQIGLLSLVIVFQPELRRLLEQAGKSRFPSFFPKSTDVSGIEYAISQTVEACEYLSALRQGSLIIFERDIMLTDAIKTGTIVNARPSAELLKNIFFPKAALHDGAVIIQNGVLKAAGCMLPMTNNTNLSRDLGMRHRAGVGVSEHSDSVAVIVSEETGSISVAIGGMLKRHLAPETLNKVLLHELIPEEDEKSKKGIFSFLNFFQVKKNEKI